MQLGIVSIALLIIQMHGSFLSQLTLICSSLQNASSSYTSPHFLSISILRKFNLKFIRENLPWSDWQGNLEVGLYFMYCLCIAAVLLLLGYLLQAGYRCAHRAVMAQLKLSPSSLHGRNKHFLRLLVLTLAVGCLFSLLGVHSGESVKLAAQRTFCAILEGNRDWSGSSLLVREGKGRTQFHDDIFYFQLKLNTIHTQTEHIMAASTLQSLPNAELVTADLAALLNSTRTLLCFINEFREVLSERRVAFLQGLLRLHAHFPLPLIPRLLAIAFRSLHLLLAAALVGVMWCGVGRGGRGWAGVVGSGVGGVAGWAGLGVLVGVGEWARVGCVFVHDFQESAVFEEYYKNYKGDFGESAWKEFMRKAEGHVEPTLVSAYGLDLSEQAVRCSALLKQIMQFSNHSSIAQLQQHLSQLMDLHSHQKHSIRDYDVRQVGSYFRAIQSQVCGQDVHVLQLQAQLIAAQLICLLVGLHLLAKLLERGVPVRQVEADSEGDSQQLQGGQVMQS